MGRESLKKKIKSVSVHLWILIAIVFLGIFLRSYHFSDWMQFGPDQARDAKVVSDFVSGKTPLPLLGPVAGGTYFKLGPIFYYFGIVSAKVFGNTPQAVAYSSLFFSILAIPLLYLFLKKYFKGNISLVLTALMSVSYFAVANSRFAWNPNMIPFFVLLFLYCLLEMANLKNREKIIFPLLLGIALGVGVQLHTFLLIIMPVISVIVFVYLLRKKKVTWKSILIVLFVFFLINSPQLLSEVKTKGENLRHFFMGANEQSDEGRKMLTDIGTIASCQVQYDIHMISSLDNIETCGDIFKTPKKFIKKYKNTPGNFKSLNLIIVSVLLSVLFSVGGYFLLGYYYFKEKKENKREFLGLIILFNLIFFAFLVPVASHITMRYYIIIFFVPFIFLGLWIKFFLEAGWLRYSKIVVIFGLALLFLSNFYVLKEYAQPLIEMRANDGENSIFGETFMISNYIAEKSQAKSTVYLEGDRIYYKRFFRPLEYILEKSGVKILNFDNADSVSSDAQIFYIAKGDSKKYKKEKEISGLKIESRKKFNRIDIFVLDNVSL